MVWERQCQGPLYTWHHHDDDSNDNDDHHLNTGLQPDLDQLHWAGYGQLHCAPHHPRQVHGAQVILGHQLGAVLLK